MNLYFQLFTQNQSKDSIKLVQFPALLNLGGIEGCRAKILAGGRLFSSSFSNIDQLSAEIINHPFNELEVEYKTDVINMAAMTAFSEKLNGVFFPSATCDLWCPSKDFSVSDRAGGMRQMNAEKEERYIAGLGISQKPSVFEFVLQIKTSTPDNQILDCCAEWVAKILNEHFENLGVFGCCDVGGQEMFVRLESNVLKLENIRVMARTLATGYPELGDKFDGLHPLMFGAKKLCVGIAADLGNDARIVECNDSRDFMVIRLAPDCDMINAAKKVKARMLPTIDDIE